MKMFDKKINFFILPNGMSRKRVNIFKEAVVKNNGIIFEEDDIKTINQNECLIILVDETNFNSREVVENIILKKLPLKVISENFKLVKCSWLSECLKKKVLVEYEKYELVNVIKINRSENKDNFSNLNYRQLNKRSFDSLNNDQNFEFIIKTKRSKIQDSSCTIDRDSETSTSSLDDSDDDNYIYQKFDNTDSYICSHSSKEQINFNKDVTDKLEDMCLLYQNTKDKYRALGYQKAIAALKRYPKRISNLEEALSLKGVGKSLAEKILEIIETGELQKLDEFNSRNDINAIKLFTHIHGVGPTTAQTFVSQGFYTLDDLKLNANLNKQQKIGLKYYDDFLKRIPREEVQEIETIVKNAALKINIGLIIQTCGSYRRNKPSCGDVDILITHPDGISHKGILSKLIDVLHEKNFLTDDLVSQEDIVNQKKYLGVCCLSGDNRFHRRLDIIVVPYDEYATSLLYFTGSAHFNRSIRLLARRLNMSLSEHSLNKNVNRKGTEKLNEGEKLITLTEECIFKHLNLTYRPPEERDF